MCDVIYDASITVFEAAIWVRNVYMIKS